MLNAAILCGYCSFEVNQSPSRVLPSCMPSVFVTAVLLQAQGMESAVRRFSKLEDAAHEAQMASDVHAVSWSPVAACHSWREAGEGGGCK